MTLRFSRYRIGLRTDYRGLQVGDHLVYWYGRRPYFTRDYYKRPLYPGE